MGLFNLGRLGEITSILLGKTSTIPNLSAYGFKTGDGYRPRQWDAGVEMQDLVYCKTNIGGFFFDAVINVSTEHQAVITSHPVQSGANISDHVCLEPVTISMQIKMSDAMDSMVRGQWHGAYTKSVSAYRKLCELQAARLPVTVLTRLNQYPNMVISGIHVDDDVNTLYGLQATIEMQQIIMATVATEKVSARNWTSAGTAKRGEISPVEEKTSVLGEVLGDGGHYNPDKGGKAP